MTALDEVLKAEQEAENQIQAAKTKSTEVAATARSARDEKLTAVEVAFLKQKNEANQAQESKTEKTMSSIDADATRKIESLRTNFSTKKSALVAELRKTFIKS